MVIYETIAGHPPFHEHADLTVFVKVLKDIRPPREVGFADRLWGMLEQCWAPQPSARPKVEDVLRCLERLSRYPEPPSPEVDREVNRGGGWDLISDSFGTFFRLIRSATFPDLRLFLSPVPYFKSPYIFSVQQTPAHPRQAGSVRPSSTRVSFVHWFALPRLPSLQCKWVGLEHFWSTSTHLHDSAREVAFYRTPS